MAMGPAGSARVLTALKKHRPDVVRIHLADDTSKEVPVGKARARWSRAVAILGDAPWVRIEFLDARGRTIAPELQNDAPAGDLEDLPTSPGATTRDTMLLNMMLRAQDVALMRHTEAFKPTLEAIRHVMRDLTDQVRLWQREARDERDERAELADQLQHAIGLAKRAENDEGAMGELQQFLAALPAIQQMLGMLLGPGKKPPQNANGAARPKPNGAAGPATSTG